MFYCTVKVNVYIYIHTPNILILLIVHFLCYVMYVSIFHTIQLNIVKKDYLKESFITLFCIQTFLVLDDLLCL